MKKYLRVAGLFIALAASAAPDCRVELPQKWNKFASDANQYINTTAAPGSDARLQWKQRLWKEWEEVYNCECF